MAIPNYIASPNGSNTGLVGGDQFDQWVRVYNHTGGTVTNGYVYALAAEVDATDTDNPIFQMTIDVPGTEADTSQEIVVIDDPSGTILNHAYGLAKKRGYIKAYCDGGTNDITYGDGVGVSNGLNYFLRSQVASSGASGQLEAETVGIALESYTSATAALKKVVLLGKQCSAIA